MISDEALKKLQEQIAAWPMTQRFVVQQLIEDYLRNREGLRAYEATGLTPESVEALQKDWSDLCTTIGECGGLDRVKELAEADKAGRVVVLPCQSGEHVFALLDDQKHVRECEVKHAVLAGWRKVFFITPVGDPCGSYGAPFGAFGKTVFLTREAAEKALEAQNGNQ